MRRLSLILSIAALSMGALGGTAVARDAPYGSYLNSCRYAEERGGIIYAECRDSSGRYRDTSIPAGACRGGDIANSDGRLYCRDGSARYDDRYDDRYRDDRRYAGRYRGRNPCGDDVALGTGLGALGGAGIGAAINRGNDTGAAIGGAIIGAIIGNQIAKNQCDDDRYDVYHYERSRYNTIYYGRPSSWRNPHTGAYGDFRIRRTYRDYGYWDDGRWYAVDRRGRRDRRYREVTCREYVETYRGPRGRRFTETHIVCNDGSTWRYVG